MSARPEARRRLLLAPLPPDDDQTNWLVTFSDLVLQLFAFVLVAAVLGARPPGAALRAPAPPAPVAAVEPAVDPMGEPAPPAAVDAPPPPAGALPAVAAAPPEPVPAPIPESAPAPAPAIDPVIAASADALRAFVKATGRDDALVVTAGTDEVVLTLGETIGFPSAGADLLPSVEPVLREVVRLVQAMPSVRIDVVGHTDDQPIRSPQFPSNLELSLARAAGVARALAALDPSLRARTFVAGFGEERPIAPNTEPAGRARNRRVDIRLVVQGDRPAPG